MTDNSSGLFGNTYTFDAGVDNSEATRNHISYNPGPDDVSTLAGSYGAPHLDDLQTNWHGGDAAGTDDDLFDLFDQFIYSSPKTPKIYSPATSRKSAKTPSTTRAKSFSNYFDPQQLFADPSEANIDPQLRSHPTYSPQRSDRASKAGTSANVQTYANGWNIPPIGHSFWETFPFQDYMTAVGLPVDTGRTVAEHVAVAPQAKMYSAPSDLSGWGERHPTQFNSPTFANPDLFSTNENVYGFPQTYQGQSQHVPSQYEQPNYYAAVPGYGLVPDSSMQYSGNTQQNSGFPHNKQQSNNSELIPQPAFSTFNQIPFEGPTGVEAYIPSADPLANDGNMTSLGPVWTSKEPTKPEVHSHGTSLAALPATWNAKNSSSQGPRKIREVEAGADGKKSKARDSRSTVAAAKAQEVYEQRPRPPTLNVHDERGKMKYQFRYNRVGELESRYTAAELRAYILHRYNQWQKKAWMIIQCVPADALKRYPTTGMSDKCRLEGCVSKKNTIAQGTFRVAFDEDVDPTKYDPYHTAGFVHLYCLERYLDLGEIARTCNIMPDNRALNRDVEGDDNPSRINLNKTSINNEKTANDYLRALRAGKKPVAGSHGQAWDYSNTLCWKLTRNATIHAKPLRTANAKHRGGVNVFVHFNDEEKKIELTERRNHMDKKDFNREMNEIFQSTMDQVHQHSDSSTAASEKKQSYFCKKRKNPESLASFHESPVRRSSRLSKPSTPVPSQGERRSPRFSNPSMFPMPVPTKTTQGRKRSHESEEDPAGSENDSPKTVRPTKKAKPNGPPTPLLPLHQGRLNSRASLATSSPLSPSLKTPVTARHAPMSSPLSSTPKLAKTPSTRERLESFEAELEAEVAHSGESSPLSPPPASTVTQSPNQGRKRSRQDSDGSIFGGNDAESPTSRSGRPIKKVKYAR